MLIPPVAGNERVTDPTEALAVIWFAVPVIEVTAALERVAQEGGLPVVAAKYYPVVPAASQEGTLVALDINTPLADAVIPPIVLAAELYKIWLIVVVVG